MIDKNPYENDDVNVPNFGETEEKGDDPIFNMDTTSVIPETDAFNVEEEAESSSKTAIIVLIVFLVIFLVGAVAGLLFGISKNGEVARITEEYSAYKKKMENQINEKNAEIQSLQLQIEQNSTSSSEGSESGSGTSEKTPADTYYLMEDGVSVRPSAGSTDSFADYSKLPDDIKNIVYKDGSKVTTRNAKFPVYETKEVGGKNWGKVADNAWVCIDFGTKQ